MNNQNTTPPVPGRKTPESLDPLRQEIDTIDQQLVTLLARRRRLVEEIAEIKHQQDLPTFHPAREENLISARRAQAVQAGMDPDYIEDLFRTVLRHSRVGQLTTHSRRSVRPGAIFISHLIDKLAAEYNIDPTHIYANGMSNGGGMSFVLSCKLSERIAAIGSVSGAYLLPWDECDSSRSVPAIVFHGTEDPIVPYQGGPSGPFDMPFPAITEWVDAFARHNGCDEAPQELVTSGDVSGVQFTNCDGDVVFYSIAGGGHSWPGGKPLPEIIVGNTPNDIDATRTMWDFFQQHPLSGEEN